jgi:hypothetical protein
MWSVESVVLCRGLRGQKGENEGLCLEGNRLCHNFLFTLWKFLQDLWMNETYKPVIKTILISNHPQSHSLKAYSESPG